MDEKKLLSVIIYVKNNLDLIDKCLRSINFKNKHDVEVIVIDGNSNDGTKEIILKYERLIDIFLSEDDHSATDAMNKGAKLANGDFITFLSSDDEYVSKNLDKSLEFIKLYKNYDLINFNTIIDFENKKQKLFIRASEKSFSEIIKRPFTNSRFYKRVKFIRLGCFKKEYAAADLLFLLEAFNKNLRVINCDLTFYKYKSHKNSKTLSFDKESILKLKLNLIKIFNYLLMSKFSVKLKSIIIYFYLRSIVKILILKLNLLFKS